jgi:integrase
MLSTMDIGSPTEFPGLYRSSTGYAIRVQVGPTVKRRKLPGATKAIKEFLRGLEAMRMPEVRRGRGKKTYKQDPKPYAKGSLASAWRTLRAFLTWATVEADLPRNPGEFVRWDVEAASPVPKAVLTQVEVGKLLAAAKAEKDPGIRVMFLVALTGALRASEISGLEVGDVDLGKGTVTVARSFSEGHLGKPKTEGSRRVVLLPPEVTAEVTAYLAGRSAGPQEILFPTSTGTRRTPASFRAPMKRLALAAGIPKHLTSHVLRRTSNNLIRQSAGDLVARAVTGHVTAEMTRLYSEVDHAERTAALRGAFGGSLGDPEAAPERSPVTAPEPKNTAPGRT